MVERLFLVGYRGSGKTTIGRQLADRLGWNFVDADVELEARHGTTIREMFANEGEPVFRDRESAILADLSQRDRVVIATGGGVVLRPENRDRLVHAGPVVWLTAEPAILWARMQADPTTAARRPDLAEGGIREVERLLAIRAPLYAAVANLTVEAGALSPEAAVDAILAAWANFGPK